ncbi:hydrogenase formation protein HypD, partial [Candidatus Pacearchaeota archaeon]|nr:hydrogenase formation protein HypD [Candidatus Pacearchaeota archaeon]
MKYTDEYRNGKLVGKLADKIKEMLKQYSSEMVLMEVCGTHTMAIFRSGLRKLLAENIRLLSGPGCPVCVTPNYYLDKAIAYARRDEVIITTFGDMMKVPGSSSSLEREKSNRGNIQVVYSALDALEIAQANPAKRVIFLGVGFETTAPTLAATIETAKQKNIGNFLVFSGHKLIPPAMRALVNTKQLHVNGFICPGHVSTIIGSRPYEFIANEYNIPCVVTGFEPLDVVQGIYMLANQIINEKQSSVQIQYTRS